MNKLTAQTNIIASELIGAERLLDKCTNITGTKEEKRELARSAKEIIAKHRVALDKYRSPLTPIVAGAPENSMTDELQKIKEDISTVLYLLANNQLNQADKLLLDIRDRL